MFSFVARAGQPPTVRSSLPDMTRLPAALLEGSPQAQTLTGALCVSSNVPAPWCLENGSFCKACIQAVRFLIATTACKVHMQQMRNYANCVRNIYRDTQSSIEGTRQHA